MTNQCALLALAALACAGAEPPPSAYDQREMIARVTENALHSQEQLPDFICTQLTKRTEDKTGKGKRFKPLDALEVEFSFIGRRPNWSLKKVNDKPTRRSYDSMRNGFLSDAILQFFSLPDSIFGEGVQPRFTWARWDTLDHKRTEVFSFRVSSADSQLGLTTELGTIDVGFHGFMYADETTGTMVRLEVQLELPRGISAQDGSIDVDYGNVKIGDQEFLLPVNAVARMRTPLGLARNETEVVRYQKYSADSSVTFGAPDR